jgi:hypothetical protein
VASSVYRRVRAGAAGGVTLHRGRATVTKCSLAA